METPRKPALRKCTGTLPDLTPPEGETPPTVPFSVILPSSADCFGCDDYYKSPRHMLDTAERDALKDPVSRLQEASNAEFFDMHVQL